LNVFHEWASGSSSEKGLLGNRYSLEGVPNDAAAAQGAQFHGAKFWARGYFVSTVGRDEETIQAYIKNQELQDREMDQLALIP
jgi:REP element-mobilizing transposase RayT